MNHWARSLCDGLWEAHTLNETQASPLRWNLGFSRKAYGKWSRLIILVRKRSWVYWRGAIYKDWFLKIKCVSLKIQGNVYGSQTHKTRQSEAEEWMKAKCLYSYEGNLYFKITKKQKTHTPLSHMLLACGLGAGPSPSNCCGSILPDLYIYNELPREKAFLKGFKRFGNH